MKFFEIYDNFDPKDRWYLGAPVDSEGDKIDSRIFTEGISLHIQGKLFVPVKKAGRILDFTLGSFEMPIVRTQLAIALEKFACPDIQRIPVTIEPQLTGFEILNVRAQVSCLDEEESEIVWWRKEDGRPEKLGFYRGIAKKVLRANAVRGQKIFRLAGWTLALFVDEDIKDFLQDQEATGITFFPVKVN